GLIAIIVGGLLVMGGLMFLLVTFLMRELPPVILIPPVAQIVLGLLGRQHQRRIGVHRVHCRILLRRGHTMAKFILLFVAIGVVINIVFLASIFLAPIH